MKVKIGAVLYSQHTTNKTFVCNVYFMWHEKLVCTPQGRTNILFILDDDASRPITERGGGGAAVDELHVMVSPASPRTNTTINNNNKNGRGGDTSAGRDEYIGESNGDYINSSTAQRARFLTSNETATTTTPSTVQDEAIHPKRPLQSDDGHQLQLRSPVSSLYTLVAAQVTGATVVVPPVVYTNSPTNRLHRAANSSASSPPSPLSPRRDQHAIINHSNNSHQGDHPPLVTMTANHPNDDGAHPLKSTAWSTSVWEVPIAIIRLDRNLSLATRQRTTTAVASDMSTLRTSENDKSEGGPQAASRRPGEHRAAPFKGKILRLSIVSDGGGGYDDDNDDEDEPAAATSTELSSPQRVVFDARRRSSGAEHLTTGGTTPRRRIASIPNNVDFATHQSTTASLTVLDDTILTTTDDGAASSPAAALGLFSRASTVFNQSSGVSADDEFVTRAHRIVGELAADWPQPAYMRLEVYKSTKYELRICVACLQGPRGSSDRKDADEERCFELLKFVAVVQQRLEAALPSVIPYGTFGPLSPPFSDAATAAAGGSSAVTVGSLIGSASRGGFSAAGAATTAGSMGMMARSSTNQRAGWSITSRGGGGRGGAGGGGGGGESAMSGAAAASLSLFERSQVPSVSHLSGLGAQQLFAESALLAQQQQRSHSSAYVNDSPFATKVPAFRVMMHVGPLVGAVIGRGSVSYDYYGHAVVEACAVLDIADGLGAAVPPVLTSVKFANLCRLVALCDPLMWRSQVDHLLSIRSSGHAGSSSTTTTATTAVQDLIGSGSGATVTTATTGVATASVGGPTTSFGDSVNLNEPPPSVVISSRRRYLPCPRRVGVIPTLNSNTILPKKKSSTAAPADGDADSGGDTTCEKSSLLKLGPDIHLRYMVGPQLVHLLPKKTTTHHHAAATNNDEQTQQQQQQLSHVAGSSSHTTTHEMETTATMTAATTSGSGGSIAAAVGGVEAADEYLSHCSASFGAHALRWWVGGQATPVDVVHVKYVA